MAIVVTLMILGFILILGEKMMPKGVFGSMGVIFLVGGIGYGYYALPTTTAHYLAAGTVVLLAISFTLWMRFFPKSRIAQKYVATGSVGEPDTKYHQWVGKTGVATTRLGPSGRVEVEGKILDVIAQGGILDKGTRVEIVEAEGNRLAVRRIAAPEEGEDGDDEAG